MEANATDVTSPPASPYASWKNIVLSAILLVGLCGNICILMTICGRTNFWKRLRPTLIFMSVNDSLLLIYAWCIYVLSEYVTFDSDLYTWYVYSYVVFYAGIGFHFTAHIWATILLTVERFIVVCYPLWHKTQRPEYLTHVLLLLTILLSLFCNIPRYFEFEVAKHAFASPKQNRSNDSRLTGNGDFYYQLTPVEALQASEWYRWYRVISKLLFTSLVPILILLYLSFKIITTVRRCKMRALPGKSIRLAEESIQYSTLRMKAEEEDISGYPDRRLSNDQMKHNLNDEGHKYIRTHDRALRHSKTDSNLMETKFVAESQRTRKKFGFHSLHERRLRYENAQNMANPGNHQSGVQERGGVNNALLVIPIAAVICYSMPTVLDIIKLSTIFLKERVATWNESALITMANISNILALSDAACNFYVYFLCSKRFRQFFLSRFKRL